MKIGEPAVEPFIQTLKDESEYVREATEEAIEKIGKANVKAANSI